MGQAWSVAVVGIYGRYQLRDYVVTADTGRVQPRPAAATAVGRVSTKDPESAASKHRVFGSSGLETKSQFKRLFGSYSAMAEALGITTSALSQWHEHLSKRQINELTGAYLNRFGAFDLFLVQRMRAEINAALAPRTTE